jgi:hypothetical protein
MKRQLADPGEVLRMTMEEWESLNFNDCPSKSFLRKIDEQTRVVIALKKRWPLKFE